MGGKAAEGGHDARGRRGGHPGLLRLPHRPLAQDQKHQPLERFNREIGRRTDVVGIFPDDRSLIHLASMLAIERNDEWLVGRRYLSASSIGPLLEEVPITPPTRRSSSSQRPEQPTNPPTNASAELLHHPLGT